MVWAGESSSPGQGRNNNGLEIGCLFDTTNGLLTFTANGKEISTYFQVDILCCLALEPSLQLRYYCHNRNHFNYTKTLFRFNFNKNKTETMVNLGYFNGHMFF